MTFSFRQVYNCFPFPSPKRQTIAELVLIAQSGKSILQQALKMAEFAEYCELNCQKNQLTLMGLFVAQYLVTYKTATLLYCIKMVTNQTKGTILNNRTANHNRRCIQQGKTSAYITLRLLFIT